MLNNILLKYLKYCIGQKLSIIVYYIVPNDSIYQDDERSKKKKKKRGLLNSIVLHITVVKQNKKQDPLTFQYFTIGLLSSNINGINHLK